MAALVAAIHIQERGGELMDGRDKPGHDGFVFSIQLGTVQRRDSASSMTPSNAATAAPTQLTIMETS